MRHFIILSVLFSGAFCYIDPEIYDGVQINPFAFEGLINETIQGVIGNLSEPITVDVLELLFPPEEGAVVVGDGTISHLSVAGIKGLEVPFLNFTLIGLTLNMTLVLPIFDLYTDFDLNLTIVDTIPIYGLGNISAHVDEIVIEVSAPVNLTDEGVSIHDLWVQLHIDNAALDLHGLFDDEELSQLLTSIINDLIVTLVDDNQELITQLISPLLQGLINQILADLLATTTPAPTTAAPTTITIPKMGLK